MSLVTPTTDYLLNIRLEDSGALMREPQASNWAQAAASPSPKEPQSRPPRPAPREKAGLVHSWQLLPVLDLIQRLGLGERGAGGLERERRKRRTGK